MKKNRRQFIKKSSLSTLTTYLGLSHPGLNAIGQQIESLYFQVIKNSNIPGKSDQLNILNERPVNVETPAHLLNDALTPNQFFFVRNNGIPPQKVDLENWKLTISGEAVKKEKSFTLNELKSTFETVNYNITLECGGNGRSEYNPPAKGNQWSTGAVGCLSLIHI